MSRFDGSMFWLDAGLSSQNGKEIMGLIVYSVGGTWWDSIDKVAVIKGSHLPCCPLCGSVLYQMEEKKWFDGIDRMEKEVPGYRKFWEWLRGKCFKNFGDALVAYSQVEPNWRMPDGYFSSKG